MKNKQTKISYADLWGLREKKYNFLESHDCKNTNWQKLFSKEPNYFFVPKDTKGEEIYSKFISISDIFKKLSSGIKTHRDHFVIGFSDQDIRPKLTTFISDSDNDLVSNALKLSDTRDWKLNIAREQLKQESINENNFYSYLWRPFDFRRIYYSKILIELPRLEIVGQMIKGPNLAFCIARKIDKSIWDDILVTNLLGDVHCASGQTYVLPLYLYSDENSQRTIFDGQEKLDIEGAQHTLRANKGKAPNINWGNLPAFCSTQTAEMIFYYIYAILYSNVYRQKYQEFLKIDFPRIPFSQDYNLFKALAQRGERLVNLHLLKSKELQNPSVKFYGRGDNSAEKREWRNNQIWINDKQYLDPIREEVWRYYIGGYQVADKWLKDRKERTLSSEDIKHYCKIATAISETIEIQKEIDRLYPKIERR